MSSMTHHEGTQVAVFEDQPSLDNAVVLVQAGQEAFRAARHDIRAGRRDARSRRQAAALNAVGLPEAPSPRSRPDLQALS